MHTRYCMPARERICGARFYILLQEGKSEWLINNDLISQSVIPRRQSWLGPVLAQAAFSLMTSPLWEALSVFDMLFVSISLRCGAY